MTTLEILGGTQVLRSKAESNLAWDRLIRNGFPFRTIAKAARTLGLSERVLATLVGISRSTFDRRKQEGRLELVESERLYRIARIFAEALNVFERPENAMQWFREPNQALGGQIPLEMLGTDAGSREVEDILGRLLYGSYS